MKLILYIFIFALIFSCYAHKTLNSEFSSIEEMRLENINGKYIGIFPYLLYKNEISDSNHYQFTIETNKDNIIAINQFYKDSLIGSLNESFNENKEVLKIKMKNELDFNFIINTITSRKIHISKLYNKTINVQTSNGGTMFFLIFPFMAANNGWHTFEYKKDQSTTL